MDFKQAKRNKRIDIWISVFLLITLFVCINFFISKIKFIVDITNDSRYSLSLETITRLNKLKTPVDVIITIQQNNKLPKIVQKFVHDLNLILDSFEKTLENFKIVPINPSGQEFDPELHEAVSTVSEPGEKDNFIAKTLERGWSLNGRVVKPALVVVNKK